MDTSEQGIRGCSLSRVGQDPVAVHCSWLLKRITKACYYYSSSRGINKEGRDMARASCSRGPIMAVSVRYSKKNTEGYYNR